MNQNNTKASVLITGAHGQLGWELIRTAPKNIELHPVDIDGLDITNPEEVKQHIGNLKPDWIINAAAYTAVDKAESEPELAYKVNRDGAVNLAQAAKQNQSRLIQISTDFVFDGQKSSPYLPQDKTNPLCVYGASKLAGEQAVLTQLGQQAIIIRTAWVYSSHGNNFVKTMLKLMNQREELGIVADQIGSPTWANGLAKAIWRVVELNGVAVDESRTTNHESPIYHWTDAGIASWYDFAVAIQEEAKTAGLLNADKTCKINPIRTEDYPTPAQRPAYSALEKTSSWQALAIQSQHWRESLRAMMKEVEKH